MLRSIATVMAVKCVFYLTLCKHQKLNPIFFIWNNSWLMLIDLLQFGSYLTAELRLDK